MTNYVKTTNFTAKDALPSGNAGKVVKGAEHDTEYDAIAVAVATKIEASDIAGKANTASPTFTGTLTAEDVTLTDTSTSATAGPTLTLHRNSTTPAANDFIGEVSFSGEDNGSNITVYAKIAGQIVDATGGSEDGAFILSTMRAGTLTQALTIDESGYFGLNNTNPGVLLTVGTGSGSFTPVAGTALIVGNSTSPAITIDGAASSSIYFAGTNNNDGYIKYNALTDLLTLGTDRADRVVIDNAGRVGIGTTGPTGLLDVVDDSIRVRTAQTPASASATGNQGEIAWDANYIYVCTATNTWKRVAIATW